MQRNQIDVDAGPRSAQLGREARRFLRTLSLEGVELSIALVNDRKIRALNKKWRKKDKATDVLSFPAGEMPGQSRHLGDIILSLDTARRAAKVYQRTVEQELTRYLAHGLLHLLGYDHLVAKDAKKMAMMERKLLGDQGMLGA